MQGLTKGKKLQDPFDLLEGVRVSVYRDGGAILDINRGRVFSLNATGSRIVALLREKFPVESIVSTVSQEFEQPIEAVRADVERFFASLRSWKLLD